MLDKRKVQVNQSLNREYQVQCVECHGVTVHHPLASVDVREATDVEDMIFDSGYQIIECQGCKTVSFREDHVSTEDPEPTHRLFPPRNVARRVIDGVWYLPTHVSTIYHETHSAIQNDMRVLAGVGIRAIVEAVCNDQKCQERDLYKRIAELAAKNVLTESGAKLLQELRVMGNQAAHEIEPHETEKLVVAMDVVDHLLTGVYVLPRKIHRLKE